MRILFTLILFLTLARTGSAQGFFNTYIVSYLQGPGTYQLADGTTSEGNLKFSTRNASVLLAGKGRKFTADQVKSFTIDGHTLVPAGNFDFRFGINSFRATNAFIELAPATGKLELAVFHICEPMGASRFSFATYLVRPQGATTWVVGPANNGHELSQQQLQLLASTLAPWPNFQQKVLAKTITFENFPAHVQQANQSKE